MIKPEHMTDAVVCRFDESVLEVSRILRDTQRRHLIVLDEKDKPVGIISTVDINNRVVAEGKEPRNLKAQEIMTKNINYVSVEDTYEKAFQAMAKLGTNSIPVTRGGKLLGMLEFMMAFRQRGEKNGA